MDVNHDSTKYAFGLPTGTSLDLPACACILLKAPGRGRGSGKRDWDGSDAVRPYTPISSNEVTGRFELLVKRYPDGAVSQYLHGLRSVWPQPQTILSRMSSRGWLQTNLNGVQDVECGDANSCSNGHRDCLAR